MTDNKLENKLENTEEKPEGKVPQPAKKIEKPLNPLAQKPGQNYTSTKY